MIITPVANRLTNPVSHLSIESLNEANYCCVSCASAAEGHQVAHTFLKRMNECMNEWRRRKESGTRKRQHCVPCKRGWGASVCPSVCGEMKKLQTGTIRCSCLQLDDGKWVKQCTGTFFSLIQLRSSTCKKNNNINDNNNRKKRKRTSKCRKRD